MVYLFQQRRILECLFANKTDSWASEFLLALESRKVNPDLVKEIRQQATVLHFEQGVVETQIEKEGTLSNFTTQYNIVRTCAQVLFFQPQKSKHVKIRYCM